MLGAIIGDIIGSTHEFKSEKNRDSPLFPNKSRITDDTILTLATSYAILNKSDYGKEYARFFSRYSFYKNSELMGLEIGFGPMFVDWAMKPDEERSPYNSFGNGSAMRVSPIAWAFESLDKVLAEAERSAICTHNHPEGIKGAKAIAGAIFLARKGHSRGEIANFIETEIDYDLNFNLKDLNNTYRFNSTCQGSVPHAIFCALNANTFNEVMRNCLFIGGDTDTIGAMAGGIAEALYGIPDELKKEAMSIFNKEPSELNVILTEFQEKYWHSTTPTERLKKKVVSKSMKTTKILKNRGFLHKAMAFLKA